MRHTFALAIVGAASFSMGALGANILSAATIAPKAYLVANITNVTNPEMLKAYQSAAPDVNAVFGGQVLARGKAVGVDMIYPPPVGTIVLLQFPDMKHLFAWYNSPAYSRIKILREKSSTTSEFAVEALVPH